MIELNFILNKAWDHYEADNLSYNLAFAQVEVTNVLLLM